MVVIERTVCPKTHPLKSHSSVINGVSDIEGTKALHLPPIARGNSLVTYLSDDKLAKAYFLRTVR